MNQSRLCSAPSRETSSAAVRNLFEWIQKRYGGLPIDHGEAGELLVSQRRLKQSHLVRLLGHQATAIHVKEFFPQEAARELGSRLAQEAQSKARNWKVSTSRGLESSDVFTLGEHAPFNVVAASSPDRREKAMSDYFDGVMKEFDYRRSRQSEESGNAIPQLWPLDLLRLHLDECWPSGAGLARETNGEKRPFSGGLPRIMIGPSRWKKGYIHVDEMGPLDPNKGLFSANIYLQMPNTEIDENQCEEKTAIQIWPVGIRNRWDWYRNAFLLSGLSSQDPEDQIRLRLALGEPVNVVVQPGDLVLICAQRPHAPMGFTSGVRVSLQCFIQHQGINERLLIDS